MKNPKLVEDDENSYRRKRKEQQRKDRTSVRTRRNREKTDDEQVSQFNIEAVKSDEANDGKKKRKLLGNKKRKSEKIVEAEMSEVDKLYNEPEDGFDEKNGADAKEKKKSKSRKKKRKNEKIKEAEIDEVEDGSDQRNDGGKMEAVHSVAQGHIESSKGQHKADTGTNFSTHGKSKKARKIRKKDHSQNYDGLLEKSGEAEQVEVYQISSGDEDCSRGMKKWMMEYHQSRPGQKILQQRIDDFIVAHEEQEEQARKEKEALAAEGGWTVVVHHKGRKKTTDSESGVAVGSVAQAALMDKMAKKKSKEVGLDFYRFQKREARMNEIMMLQSKFEQDKKRIQQLRAERKFRPY